MVFKERFVVVIKQRGRILREIEKDMVLLPFGSEYSLLLKNLESRRASVNIHIDGQDVLFGKSLILQPNSTLELERFLDNLNSGNRFKFIQKTKEIVNHRGDRVDDGIVRVEFAFEQQVAPIVYYEPYYPWRPYCSPSYTYTSCENFTINSGLSSGPEPEDVVTSYNCSSEISNCNSNQSNVCHDSIQQPVPNEDEGITVKGSCSNQKFSQGCIGLLDASNVITIKLRGVMGNVRVHKSVTVKTKLTCPTCGRRNKSYYKFCSNCGTSLV